MTQIDIIEPISTQVNVSLRQSVIYWKLRMTKSREMPGYTRRYIACITHQS
ncbi:hypothetical protein ACNF40_08660 [Cuniculiplasma sp. SKW4]|uniref:hypothetical protein n=1 Tax=Cuniculiplasma sp. SKW4 TaxID=3400171 RepID=UPI003FCF8C6E